MDYRELLIKYMSLVRDEESVTFLERADDLFQRHAMPLTNDEVIELRKIEAELPKERGRIVGAVKLTDPPYA